MDTTIYLTTISVNVCDRVCLCVRILSSPEPLEVWKHEWYHVVTNCQGHVLSPSGLPKVAKKRQKSQKLISLPVSHTPAQALDSVLKAPQVYD